MINCYQDNDKIHIVLNNHKLDTGQLKGESTIYIPNSIYPDNTQKVVSYHDFGISITKGNGSFVTPAQLELLFPYIKGDKGDPFTYDNFTQEQIAELQRPATDIAQTVADAEALRVNAENERETAEQLRFDAEEGRVVAERSRVEAEQQRAEEFAAYNTYAEECKAEARLIVKNNDIR